MAHSNLLLVGVLYLSCWAFLAEAGEYAKYKDPKQPIYARIKDLMKRMTLKEKIGQMTQIDRTAATAEIMRDYSIGKIK